MRRPHYAIIDMRGKCNRYQWVYTDIDARQYGVTMHCRLTQRRGMLCPVVDKLDGQYVVRVYPKEPA